MPAEFLIKAIAEEIKHKHSWVMPRDYDYLTEQEKKYVHENHVFPESAKLPPFTQNCERDFEILDLRFPDRSRHLPTSVYLDIKSIFEHLHYVHAVSKIRTMKAVTQLTTLCQNDPMAFHARNEVFARITTMEKESALPKEERLAMMRCLIAAGISPAIQMPSEEEDWFFNTFDDLAQFYNNKEIKIEIFVNSFRYGILLNFLKNGWNVNKLKDDETILDKALKQSVKDCPNIPVFIDLLKRLGAKRACGVVITNRARFTIIKNY